MAFEIITDGKFKDMGWVKRSESGTKTQGTSTLKEKVEKEDLQKRAIIMEV